MDPDSARPIPGAKVLLLDGDSVHQVVAEATTNSRGQYRFGVYTAGMYTVVAEKRGIGTAREICRVAEGDSLEINLELKK